MAFEQVFKNIDNALRTDEGCSSELDYVEQSSWILFLKYLDDLGKENEMAALLGGGAYTPILNEEYRWNTWAMPRTKSGEYDIHSALVGDDLIEFVNGKLFPYLKNLATNCIPEDVFEMDESSYDRFLGERRQLMAQKIRKFYESL